jgi:uncharacterized protein (TIGR02186 family)
MKQIRLIAAVTAVLLWVLSVSAMTPDAQDVVTDSTKAQIEIGLTYHGDRIYFFGTMDGTDADDVVVKLVSPAENVKLNIKGRVGPLWMNVKQYEVENVPFMYKIHASDRLERILPPELAEELGIGFENVKHKMKLHLLKGTQEDKDFDVLFEGLMKLKKKANLYRIDDASRVQIKKGQIFKHYFTFPSTAKAGQYIVESYLFKNQRLVGRASDTVDIRKVGLEAFVVNAANESPVIYGICAVLIALGAGLLVGFVFKGGGH